MTPYLLYHTWLDLDHVLAAESSIAYDTARSHLIKGRITMAFRDEPLEIVVGVLTYHPVPRPLDKASGLDRWSGYEEAQAVWDAFIAAWKARTP